MALTDAKWYKNWFGNDYLQVYSHRDQNEAKQLVQLIQFHINLKPDARILDIGCGQGRHLSIFAKKKFQITGIDLSSVLLRIAKENNLNNPTTHFIQADMRYLPINFKFDLILNLFTSFGYFEDDEENKSVLCQVSKLLKKSGRFVFDYFNSNYVKNNLVPKHYEKIGDLIIEQERYIENSRIKKKINLTKKGKKSTYFESVKLYSPEEIYEMLRSVNLKISTTFGNYDGSVFDDQSPRLIVFGEIIE
jgi:SAM-dependent methyltransferase